LALSEPLDRGPQQPGAEAKGTLEAPYDAAAIADDALYDDESNDRHPTIIKHQPLGERLWQSSCVLLYRL